MICVNDGLRRIAFVIDQSAKVTREWFKGTMHYARLNTNWFVRIFETGFTLDENYIDFGPIRPDGIILCGLPVRYVHYALERKGIGDVPILAVMQERPCLYPHVITAGMDMDTITRTAMKIFLRCGCRSVAYAGAQMPNEMRASREIAHRFASVAAEMGMPYDFLALPPSRSMGLRIALEEQAAKWLAALPKPVGLLTWNDRIGRDMLDLCRLHGVNVPGAAYVVGIDNEDYICESATPTLTSISLDYERAAYQAAKALDAMIDGCAQPTTHVICPVRMVMERGSTQDPKGAGHLVARAREFIAANACREGGLSTVDVANHLNVSVRTLQMRFRDSDYGKTIVQEIRNVQLEHICHLLKTTDLQIEELTFKSGFNSQSRLKSLFKQAYGVNMREYRRVWKRRLDASEANPPADK